MTACLAICRDGSWRGVDADQPTGSHVAASDAPAFPKAAAPGTSRASGVSKFFENIKPLSDFVGAILDAAGRGIGKLFGFDKLLDGFDKLLDCEVSATGQEKPNSESVKNHSPLLENDPGSENATAAFSSEVRNGQDSNSPEGWEGTFFNDPITDGDWAKVIGVNAELESSFSAPEEVQSGTTFNKQAVAGSRLAATRKSGQAIRTQGVSYRPNHLNRKQIDS